MNELAKIQPVTTLDQSSFGTQRADRLDVERTLRAVRFLNRTEFSENGPNAGSSIKFSYDDAAQRGVVSVVDHRTGNVLYQIPSRELLKMEAQVRQRARTSACTEDDAGILA